MLHPKIQAAVLTGVTLATRLLLQCPGSTAVTPATLRQAALDTAHHLGYDITPITEEQKSR